MTNQNKQHKLIILDRDGVINYDSDEYVKSISEWMPLPKSIEAIAKLSKAGYTIFVATNQSGLARNFFTIDTLNAMHSKMNNLVEGAGGKIEAIKYCPHGPNDNCDCRKPLPGMFKQIAEDLGLDDLKGSYTVGDSARDLYAGCQLQSIPILVRTGKGLRTIAKGDMPSNTVVYDDLMAFAESLLK